MSELSFALRTLFRKSLFAFLAAVVLMLAGCGGVPSSGSSDSPTPSVKLSAQPTSITAGNSVTLTWNSQNATSVTIDNGVGTQPASGTWTGTPTTTTTYTATAANGSQTAKSSVTITVNAVPPPAAPTISLTASPTTITSGDPTTLTWTSTNADSVTIDNGIGNVNLSDSRTVSPTTTTTYIATAIQGSQKVTSSVTVTVNALPAPAVSITANPMTITSGDSTTLTWTSTNSDSVTIDNGIGVVNLNGSWTGKPTATTTYTATATQGSTAVHSSVTVTVNPSQPPPPSSVAIPTWHADNARSGLNSNETTLTPTSVSSGNFGRLFSYSVDGYIYAQPLYVSGLTINGVKRNVVFVATEYDKVYAFDADNYSGGQPLWSVSLLQSGEQPLYNANPKPWTGITATPAIDLGTNTMYVVSEQKGASGGTFRLHALDILTGQEKLGGPVQIKASVSSTAETNGVLTLTTSCLSRASLLVTDTSVVFGMGACGPGWVLSYDKTTLQQNGVLNTSPNQKGYGPYPGAGGVWMGGAGPAEDSNGNIYVATGDGPYDNNTSFGDSVLKLNSKLQIIDHFTPSDYNLLQCRDSDLASGGLSLTPDGSQIMAGGKRGVVYLLNTNNLGKEQANDAGAAQFFFWDGTQGYPSPDCKDPQGNVYNDQISGSQLFSTGAWFNGSVYIGADPGPIRQFKYSGGQLSQGTKTPTSYPQHIMGTTPFVSSNGTSSGIVWAIDHGAPIQNTQGTPTSAVLHAYDATDLSKELYNSSTNSGDTAGYGIKLTSPIVANGKVFIGTGQDLIDTTNPSQIPKGELDVYGLRQ